MSTKATKARRTLTKWSVPKPPRGVVLTGGRFNREVGHHFIVGDSSFIAAASPRGVFPTGVLISVEYSGVSMKGNRLTNTDKFTEVLDNCTRAGTDVLVDSGAFTLVMAYVKANGGNPQAVFSADSTTTTPEFIHLDNLYRRFLHKFGSRLWGYIEMDVGTTQKRRETRASYIAEGLKPIPVFRPGADGWEYFEELLGSYDRVCFGGAVKMSRSARTLMLYEASKIMHRYPHCSVHVLGSKPSRELTSLGFHTSDSTTYLNLGRYALVSKLHAGGRIYYRESALLRDFSSGAPDGVSPARVAQLLGAYQYAGFTRSRNLMLASMRQVLNR